MQCIFWYNLGGYLNPCIGTLANLPQNWMGAVSSFVLHAPRKPKGKSPGMGTLLSDLKEDEEKNAKGNFLMHIEVDANLPSRKSRRKRSSEWEV